MRANDRTSQSSRTEVAAFGAQGVPVRHAISEALANVSNRALGNAVVELLARGRNRLELPNDKRATLAHKLDILDYLLAQLALGFPLVSPSSRRHTWAARR